MSERSTCVDINTRGGITFVPGDFKVVILEKGDKAGTLKI